MEFRKMRRFKQQLSDIETLEIVKRAKTAILGVNGDGGYPYTVPINYVYSDNKIYFHGAKAGHKFEAIQKNNKVTLSIVDKDDIVKAELTTYFRSVSIFGLAKILDTDEEIFRAAEVLGLKYNENKEAVDKEIEREWRALCCIEISIEHMTGKEAIELTRAKKK
jgi:nitroimidazol reductase NimA-like FMN-containing flavoprotein (pyridoxamine 5'-phosphate oxidase superfamily)